MLRPVAALFVFLVLGVFPGRPYESRETQAKTASLFFTSPRSDGMQVKGTFLFAVDAGRLPNVATVEFGIGSLRLGVAQNAPYEVSWNTGFGKDGNYAVQATARDSLGRVIGTCERTFNIENSGVTMVVRSPDLSQKLHGTIAFEVPANDPIDYPAIFHLFIDGELSGYSDVGSSTVTHHTKAVFNVDTTRFSNGRHELVIDLNCWKETAEPHTYTNYSAMLSRIITIDNGHTPSEIAANYQNLYLQPGQSLALTCIQLFSDNTSGTCSNPVYSSANPLVASVSDDGRVEAKSSGFTTVLVKDAGMTTKAFVWVKSNSNVPHFSGSGRLLNSYQPGASIFPVAPFGLDPIQPEALAEARRAGFNTVSFGFYLNPRSTTMTFTDWKSVQDRLLTSRINRAKDEGFHIIATGDDAFRRPGDDAWWTLNWPYGRQATQYAMQTLADSGIAIATEVVDEAAMLLGWYPVSPSKVGQHGLPGQPDSFQSVSCAGRVCTVNWPYHGYKPGRWVAFKGSKHPELNTPPGQPFVVLTATQNTFDFAPNAQLTDTLTSDNDPDLEIMLFAASPCNAGTTDGKDHPCVPFTPNDVVKTYSSWLRSAPSHVPFSWPALGTLPPPAHMNWVGKPAIDEGISDYASHYWTDLGGSRTYSWSAGVQQRLFWMKDAFYSRQPYMAQERPQLMLVCGSSFTYTKRSPGAAYYNPPADTLDQPGCDGASASAEIMTAAALGNAGVRQYQFDVDSPATRAGYPAGAYLQTGMRPDSTERNSKEIWQATAYAAHLLTRVLQPYILGAAANSPAYSHNITTAVRRGTDATMLLIINGNDADRSVSVDFRPYRTGVDVARYRLSCSYLQSDLVADTTGETITLPRGGSVVYLFPFSSSSRRLETTFLRPTLPAGANHASLSYNYLYGEHLSQLSDGVECTKGCAVQVDARLGEIYYQFTYIGPKGNVIGRSRVAELKPFLPH